MQRYFTIFSFLLFIFIANSNNSYSKRNLDSRDLAVLIDVTVTNSPPAITLNWAKNELAIGYEVRRKLLTDEFFPSSALITLDSATYTYTDNTVKVGTIYEYEVRANSVGIYTANGQAGTNFIGFGYVTAAINAEIPQSKKLLLIIDSTIVDPLTTEITRLKDDLVTEGFNVFTLLSPRAEQFDKDKVAYMKSKITQENSNGKIDYIYLLGRVPVPYSGDIAPDGHVPDHRGAWPADIYYGHFDETWWTDNSINVSLAARAENKNIPGDGKFDLSVLYNNQGFQTYSTAGVGRVDFYNMPAFSKSEIELLKAYLDKNHNFRTDKTLYVNKGLIDDNFNAAGLPEAFASTGWRSFGSLVGSTNVEKADYFTKLGTDSYLWAYGTGPGSYSSAGGIGNTSDFASKQVNNIFSMLFGSYFGDWDSKDNFLRAALASDGNVLTCSWSARPHWFYHHMGLGLPIGYSTLASVNNYTGYIPNYYIPNNGFIYAFSQKGTHAALMGDPTLSMNEIDKITPAKNLQITQKGYKAIELKWETPLTDIPHYYDIYRADNYYGPYKKLNLGAFNKTIDVIGGTYLDDYNKAGKVYYMVRKRELKTSNSGSFFNLSRGVIGEIEMSDLTSVENEDLSFELSLYPNPVVDNLQIKVNTNSFENGTNVKIDIVSITGEIIKSFDMGRVIGGVQSLNIDVKSLNINSGVYYVQLTNDTHTISQKFIFNR